MPRNLMPQLYRFPPARPGGTDTMATQPQEVDTAPPLLLQLGSSRDRMMSGS